ncbi:MAG: ABC transporter permease [Bacteroidales bacterium]|jgi:putative ABC transport system permease protein|nr:ABC transporter permease [Bacteroidales bacterium]MDD2263434.1 ABC transporter permease [Bacteroidales bacterium]MDD2830776.1 ABC transporter permease [Bacteroidales bacterium]MDD3207975.1 ABC transporter permease [Bacteroidales bacterium]MDD3696518.1 ABC transporter permease [Bacteroidales bacterium]
MKKIFRSINIFFKLLGESFVFAYDSVKGDKFRAFLSLLGVTIGIFSIVAVFTAIEGLEKNVRNMFSSLGTDVVYVDKISWESFADGEGFKWWEFRQRPNNTYEEFLFLQKNVTLADMTALSALTSTNVRYGRNMLRNTTLYGVTYYWNQISYFEIDEGRYFTPSEAATNIPLAVIGRNVAEELFPEGLTPVNNNLKVGGFTVRVIGVIKKKGESMFDPVTYDDAIIIPLPFIRNYLDLRRTSPNIVVHKDPRADEEEFMAQLRNAMRVVRRLKPIQNDNFALNKMSFLDDALSQLFSVIAIAGWIIGGFSILIGAFGVANIMFVSVKERTHIIGIEKAMGAKSSFVLTQFLFEAALLAIMGGLIGILIVWVLTIVVTNQYDFVLTMSTGNILRGVLISGLVGVIAGFIPSLQAARMNPVEAMNQH